MVRCRPSRSYCCCRPANAAAVVRDKVRCAVRRTEEGRSGDAGVVVTAVVGLEEDEVKDGNMVAGARTVAVVVDTVFALRAVRTEPLRFKMDSEGNVGRGAGGNGRRGAPEAFAVEVK